MRKKLRVMVLMHPDLVPPESLRGYSDAEINAFKAEYDVISALRDRGHEVLPLGVQEELAPIRDTSERFAPHVAFNLLEEFHHSALYDHSVVSYLELLRVAYTGCNPRGLMLARSKAIAKQLLAYHRVLTPGFHVFPLGRKARRPSRLRFPLIVKSVTEHASLGISQASLVDDDAHLVERVAFIHERVGTDAIAEEYIDGREIYVGVMGNDRLLALPAWELVADNLPENRPFIATAKVKHDVRYQEKAGIRHEPADGLSDVLRARMAHTAKRIYRVLELDGYARIDFRLAADGRIFFLDANPNPDISDREEFSAAAAHVGIGYPDLLQRILGLAMSRARQWVA